jgi:hypothetical protein
MNKSEFSTTDDVVNEQDIRRTYREVAPKFGEIRAFDPHGVPSHYGYADEEQFVQAAIALNRAGFTVYCVLNEIDETFFQKMCRNEEIIGSDGNPVSATQDEHIDRRKRMIIDVDPARFDENGKETSPLAPSTYKEQLRSYRVGMQIYRYLKASGFPEPLLGGMSGNGNALLYAINLPNTPANAKLMRDFLRALDHAFSTDEVGVDIRVSNPSRIYKVFGTTAYKGNESPGRKHRLSKIRTHKNPSPVPVPRNLIEKVAAQAPPERQSNHTGTRPAFPLVDGSDERYQPMLARLKDLLKGYMPTKDKRRFAMAVGRYLGERLGFDAVHDLFFHTWSELGLPDNYRKDALGILEDTENRLRTGKSALGGDTLRREYPGLLDDMNGLCEWTGNFGAQETAMLEPLLANIWGSGDVPRQDGRKAEPNTQGRRGPLTVENAPLDTIEDFLNECGEETDWIIKDLLAPGELTMFSGRGKTSGKTTFWCHAIAACAARKDHVGKTTKPARFLYLTEQGKNFRSYLEDAGILDHGDHIRLVPYKKVAFEKWETVINVYAEVCRTQGYDALIVDTAATFAGLKGKEENDAGTVGEKCRVLRTALQVHNIAGVLIRHSGKDDKGRGSSAFEDEADIVVEMTRPEGNHNATVRKLDVIGRHGGWQLNIELRGEGYVALDSDDRVEFNKAVGFIRQALENTTCKENGRRRTEISKEGRETNGFSESTLRRAMEWLVGQKEVAEEALGAPGKPKVCWKVDALPSALHPVPPEFDANKSGAPFRSNSHGGSRTNNSLPSEKHHRNGISVGTDSFPSNYGREGRNGGVNVHPE